MVGYLKFIVVCFFVLAYVTYAISPPKKGFFGRFADKFEERVREKVERERQETLEMLRKMQKDVQSIQGSLRNLEVPRHGDGSCDQGKTQ